MHTNTKHHFVLTLLFSHSCYSGAHEKLHLPSVVHPGVAQICHPLPLPKHENEEETTTHPLVNHNQVSATVRVLPKLWVFLPEIIIFPVDGTCSEQMHPWHWRQELPKEGCDDPWYLLCQPTIVQGLFHLLWGVFGVSSCPSAPPLP